MIIDEFRASLIQIEYEVNLAVANMSNPERIKKLTEFTNSLDVLRIGVND